MQIWTDWEKQDLLAIKLKEEKDSQCITCPKCSSQWMEEVKIQRYIADHHVILGQSVPPKPGSMPYVMLRCVQCQTMLEPKVMSATRDLGGDDYSLLLDTLDGKFDTRKEKKEEKPSDAIPSQRL